MSAEDVKKYIRQIQLDNFGQAAQQKLKEAKVLLIGAGGLGNPAALYLASAGIGRLDVIDGDKVEESNLPRQPLYTLEDIGKPKAALVAERIGKHNPQLIFNVFEEHFSEKNAAMVAEYDLVLDCTDNFYSRYLISDACEKHNVACVFGAAEAWSVQVSVFNYLFQNGQRSPAYKNLFPEPPQNAPDCDTIGVMATVPAIAGSIMANEAIKCLSGVGKPLAGTLLTIDCLNNEYHSFTYWESKVLDRANNTEEELEIETDDYLAHKDDYQLIDIREEHEWENENAGGINIPYYDLLENPQLDDHIQYLLICDSGKRGKTIAKELQVRKFSNVRSLKGGLQALLKK